MTRIEALTITDEEKNDEEDEVFHGPELDQTECELVIVLPLLFLVQKLRTRCYRGIVVDKAGCF
jgi:hypothetical protein